MKRSVTTALAIFGLTTPALAQVGSQTDTQVREQADALVQKYDNALSHGNWLTLSNLYLPGALVMTPLGKLEDGKTDSHVADKLHSMGFRETSRIEEVQPVFDGKGLLVTAAYTGTFSEEQKIPPSHGYDLFVLEKVGDEWKIRANSASRLVPSAPPGGASSMAPGKRN